MAEENALRELGSEQPLATEQKPCGFRPAGHLERPPGIKPPVAEEAEAVCDGSTTKDGSDSVTTAAEMPEDPKEEASAEPPGVLPKTLPQNEPTRTLSASCWAFPPLKMGLLSFGALLALIVLVILGVWALQLLQQHHMTEKLLRDQDKARRHQVEELNEQLADMSDQKLSLQRRAFDFQSKAAGLQKQLHEFETQSVMFQQQSEQNEDAISSRDETIRQLQGELDRTHEEQNATVAKFMQQLNRDTGLLADAAEADSKNMANAAKALRGKGEEVKREKRQVQQLRHDLEEARSQQKSLKEQLQQQSHAQKTMADSMTTWKQKLQVLEDQKEALRHDLDNERETLKLLATNAKEKLESASLEAKKHADHEVAKMQDKMTLQENLVQSLLQQLQRRTAERDAGKLRVSELQRRMQQQELQELQAQREAINARLENLAPESGEAENEDEERLPSKDLDLASQLRGQWPRGKKRVALRQLLQQD